MSAVPSSAALSRRQLLQTLLALTATAASRPGRAGEDAPPVIPSSPAIVGTRLPTRTLWDANADPVPLDASVRAIVFTADRQASAWAHPALAEWGAAALDQHHVIVLVDLSAMPALITRMFALPKLRALPFPLGLVQDAAETADLPRQAGQATLIQLEALEVTDIRFLPDAAALQAALQALPLASS